MGILDYFKTISTITPNEVRDLMKKHNPGDYNLVDVRQPKEYAQGHLPGARLIPAGELRERAGELDPQKPTIAY
jgi:rhodanese-related sulfurtransferase